MTEYDCGWCDWTYETSSFKDGAIKTVKHYNYHHSIQGWIYRAILRAYQWWVERKNMSDRPPRNAKESAVQQWNDAISDLPDDREYKQKLKDLDIHDSHDRMEISEIIHHDVLHEDFGQLEDAYDDLKKTFDW